MSSSLPKLDSACCSSSSKRCYCYCCCLCSHPSSPSFLKDSAATSRFSTLLLLPKWTHFEHPRRRLANKNSPFASATTTTTVVRPLLKTRCYSYYYYYYFVVVVRATLQTLGGITDATTTNHRTLPLFARSGQSLEKACSSSFPTRSFAFFNFILFISPKGHNAKTTTTRVQILRTLTQKKRHTRAYRALPLCPLSLSLTLSLAFYSNSRAAPLANCFAGRIESLSKEFLNEEREKRHARKRRLNADFTFFSTAFFFSKGRFLSRGLERVIICFFLFFFLLGTAVFLVSKCLSRAPPNEEPHEEEEAEEEELERAMDEKSSREEDHHPPQTARKTQKLPLLIYLLACL
jgi:hypothetical protein